MDEEGAVPLIYGINGLTLLFTFVIAAKTRNFPTNHKQINVNFHLNTFSKFFLSPILGKKTSKSRGFAPGDYKSIYTPTILSSLP